MGYGHTTAAGPPKVVAGITITDAQCDQILAADLGAVEKDVGRLIKVLLSQPAIRCARLVPRARERNGRRQDQCRKHRCRDDDAASVRKCERPSNGRTDPAPQG
ncbi:glycoside hydrolase family protein [Bradyrhizobium sp. i1.12.3]|uniref:glycoside hydrolase family protein n=1 Tax=unclassified Bradyrhizobium TaxID=2631580 RepID=UPI003D20E037